MRAISVGQGCTRVRRGRRKELLLVVLELHLSRSLFSLSALLYQGGGREGGGLWGMDLQDRSPRFPAPTTQSSSSSSSSSSRGRCYGMPHTQAECAVLEKLHRHRNTAHHSRIKRRKSDGCVSLGLSSFRLFVSQAHSNRSIALLLIVRGAGGGSGMLHHTKVNDCVTEAGCNKQSGMTHFPEGWTRLGRRRRWLASPSGLARERAREKKKKGGTVHPRISCGRPLSQWWREGYTGAKRKKIPGWSRPAGSGWLGLGAYRYMSDWATHTLVCIRRSLAP